MGIGSFLFGKKAKVDPYGALNSEQVAINKQLGPYLQSRINRGPTPYTGQLNTQFGAGEQDILNNYNTMNSRRNVALQNIIGDGTDAGFGNEFNTQVADPTLDYFNRNIRPLIEESLPTFSTARANVVGNKLTDLTGELSQQRFDAIQKRRDQAISASGAFNDSWAQAAGQNAAPREITQAGLDRDYLEFTRQQTQDTQYVNSMLNFLGISTGTVEPATEGLLKPLLIALAGGAAAAAGAGSGGTTAKAGGTP